MKKRLSNISMTGVVITMFVALLVIGNLFETKAAPSSSYGAKYGPVVEEEEEHFEPTKEETKEEKEEREQKEAEAKPFPVVSVPVQTEAQRKEAVRNEQGVVGSAAYTAQQTQVVNTVTEAVASITAMTPEQLAVVKDTGVGVNMAGCTTFSPALVKALATNNTVPYNVGFTWNGIAFSLKIPEGVNVLEFANPDGSIPMWKLVQKYGISFMVPQAK